MDTTVEQYPCLVQDVYSGDDLVVFVDLGVENLWKRQRVRLHGVDTPNAMNSTDATPAGRVRREVQQVVRNRRGIVTVLAKNANSWVCRLVVEAPAESGGSVDVNQMLIERGYVFKRT